MLVCSLTGCNSSSVAELEHILSFPHTLPAALPQPGSVKWHGFIFYTQQIHKSLGQCRFLAPLVCSPQAVSMCVFVCVCMHVFVCVCVCVDGMNLTYMLRWHIHVSVHSVLCTQAHTRRSLKPSEDSEPMGLKVDIAKSWLFAVTRPACCGGSPMSAAALNWGVSDFGQLIQAPLSSACPQHFW